MYDLRNRLTMAPTSRNNLNGSEIGVKLGYIGTEFDNCDSDSGILISDKDDSFDADKDENTIKNKSFTQLFRKRPV